MNTTKSFPLKSFACALAVLAAPAGAAGAALTLPLINPGSGFVASATGTACNVDTPPVISVTSSGYDAVWVNFRYKGATWRLPMTNGVTPYCLQMPVIPAGAVEYRIEAGTVFDPYPSTNAVEALPSASTYYTYVNTATLGNARKPNMKTWFDNVFYPNYDNGDLYPNATIDADWRSSKLSMNPYYLILRGYETSQGGASGDPGIRTMAPKTVGSIWFKAQYNGNDGFGTLSIERSTNPNPSLGNVVIQTIQVPATTKWVQYRIDLNDISGLYYYRIRHPSGSVYGDANINVKDIVLSPPVADVAISKATVEHDPGYPSRTDPVTFTISVTNVFAGAPASNISPKLVWRLNKGLVPGAWNTTYMAPIGGDEYQVTLPPLDPGDFQYYYRADFTGYAYTGKLYDPTAIPPEEAPENVDEFSTWLDASKQVAEMRFPAYYPDFTNSQLYDLGVDPPVCINDGSVLDEEVEPFDYLGFTVRRFRSMHDEVNLNIQDVSGNGLTIDPTYNMEQVGDYIWQSVIYMTNAVAEGINVDVGIAVVGTDRYLAPSPYYESQPHNWLAIGQDDSAWNPPMAGFLTDNPPGGTPRLRVQIDYDGFLMFRFCTTNGSYEIRRAAWQDFNSWQALDSETEGFTRSFGLYETTSFESDLDDFPPSSMESAGFLPFETGTTASDAVMLSSTYLNGIKVDKAWVVEERERPYLAGNEVTTKNRALKLSANPVQLGSIETTSVTGSDGRDTLTLRVRASVDDDNRSYYRLGDTMNNYIFVAKATTTSMSDDDASVSAFGYYQDELNYIEARLSQTTTLRSNNTTLYGLRMELFQMKNGVETSLGSTTYTSGNNSKLTSSPWTLKLKIVSSGSSGTAEFILNDGSSNVKTTAEKNFTIDTSTILMGGTVGVNVRDAATTFEVGMTDIASNPISEIADSSATAWYLGGKLDAASANRWTFAPTPAKLTRVIPAVKYRVNVYRDGIGNDNTVAPVPSATEDWDQDWDDIGSADGERTTSSLAWQTVSVPMHLWDDVFIQIKPTGTDGALVVDDLNVYDWRGMTLYDDQLSENDPFEELVWKATYAVRSNVDGSIQYELNRTRANPDENQMIVTPLLEDGIGDLLFNYRVATGNVQFSVQTLKSNGAVDRTLLTTNVLAGATIERMYVAALTNMTGRFRVLVDPMASSADGVLYLDNFKATDYPDVGDTSWEAYNLLISTYAWDPEIKFDGAANTDFRSATINDGYTNNTPLGVAYDTDEPFLQSPKIETGIGEVSFWYRRYPDATKIGKVYLKAAKVETDFDNNPGAVITLGVFDLNTNAPTYSAQVESLANLTNVTTDIWTYFSVEFFKAEYKILRFYGDTETGARVMLDNIIVTEPVRSSIDIKSVELIPAIPLYTDNVGVRVNLENPRMNPGNIQVSLLYTVGTNQWGRENWMGSAASISLVADTSNPYLFTVTNAIPKLPIDTVVQYSVKVTYTGTFPEDVYFGEEFVNPAWYEPIDLNEQYAAAGKSPYYYVLSVGTNCVLINEFLPYAYQFAYYGLDEQYVEMIGVDNGNIANWRLEHVDPLTSANEDDVFWTNVIKEGAVFNSRYLANSQEPTDKGWGFYTLACEGVNNSNINFDVISPNPIVVDQELFPASLYLPGYTGFPEGEPEIAMGVPGALCLRRSMGAYVHRLVWGEYTTVTGLVARGYTYCGTRGTTSSNRRKVFIWTDNEDPENPALEWDVLVPLYYSPGYYNYGQAALIWPVVPADEEEPTNEPIIGQPQITSITVGETAATVVFDVWTVNDVALTPQDSFTWYIETSEDPTFANPSAYEITSDISAPSDGSPSSYSVDVDFGVPASQSLFYRIKAVHP